MYLVTAHHRLVPNVAAPIYSARVREADIPAYTAFVPNSVVHCTLAEPPERCDTSKIPIFELGSRVNDRSDSSSSTEVSSIDSTSTREPSVESSVSSLGAPSDQENKLHGKATEAGEQMALEEKDGVEEASVVITVIVDHEMRSASAAKEESGVHCSFPGKAIRKTGRTEKEEHEDDTNRDADSGETNSDNDSIYEDDPEVPAHHKLKRATEFVWFNLVPHIISEEEREEGSMELHVEQAEVVRSVPIIGKSFVSSVSKVHPDHIHPVVESPTLEKSFLRVLEATEDLAALLESMDDDPDNDAFEPSFVPDTNANNLPAPGC